MRPEYIRCHRDTFHNLGRRRGVHLLRQRRVVTDKRNVFLTTIVANEQGYLTVLDDVLSHRKREVRTTVQNSSNYFKQPQEIDGRERP